MKQKKNPLAQLYVNGLRKHLQAGPQASLQPALKLGRQAVVLGMETLDLARMHEQALATLELSNTKNAFTKLAGLFFNEANRPIEETHRAARQSQAHLSRLETTLGLRIEELAVSKRKWQRGVVRHKAMELAAGERGRHHQKDLKESLALQKRLRQLTHRVMAAREDDRRKISRELQDEIAQTLLGINVRLLTLKQGDHDNTKFIQNEIASTQRLVVKSARTVRRYARSLDANHSTQAIQSPGAVCQSIAQCQPGTACP